MKLRTILCQAEAVSQENSVTLMDKLSLAAAFSWALLYEPNEPIVASENRRSRISKATWLICRCFQQLSVESSCQTNPCRHPTVALSWNASWATWCWCANTGSRSSPCWATQRQSDPDLTLQLCVPPTTMWPLRFLQTQRDVLSNYNNINIMSFPCSAARTL